MQGGIKDRRRPQPFPGVVPNTRLPRNPQFNVIMSFPRIKPSDAATAAGVAVEVRRVTNVPAQIQRCPRCRFHPLTTVRWRHKWNR